MIDAMKSHAPVPTKREQFQAFLDRGSVFVHLDPRRPGVAVPASLALRPRAVLQVKRVLTIPLPDIEADDEGVRVTLTFGGVPFRCVLPWSSVFSLVADDGEVTVWPLELPAEVAPERSPESLAPGAKARNTGRPLSLPPPSLQPKPRASKKPSRAPAAAADEGPSASVIPGSLRSAERIPRAPGLPKSMFPAAFAPDVELEPEPVKVTVTPARRRSDSMPAASRAERANDSLSIAPKKPRDPK